MARLVPRGIRIERWVSPSWGIQTAFPMRMPSDLEAPPIRVAGRAIHGVIQVGSEATGLASHEQQNDAMQGERGLLCH